MGPKARPDRAEERAAMVPMIGEREPSAVHLGRSALSERAADRLAALTAQAAAVPAVVIQLVHGDRLRLIGGVGLPSGWGTLPEIPLDTTVAGQVLATGLPVVVDDVAHDRRVPEDAPLRLFGVRAFLGFPVRDQDDEPVGVCCALDLRPRVWTADEMRAVDHAAEACTALVAKQLARQEVERQRRFLDAILASLRVGVAACDASGRVTMINSAMRELVGDPLPTGEVPLLRVLRGEPVRDAEALVVGPDGRRRLLQMDGQPITDPGAGAVVTVQDVTARRRAERFRAGELAVATALAEAATIHEAGPRILAAVAGTLGWPHAELWLVDDRGEVLRPVAHWSAPELAGRVTVPAELSRGAGLVGAAWHRGGPVWIHDLDRPQSEIQAGLHAAIAIPVRSGGDTLGVLSVFADAVEEPEDGLVALLSGIAAHIGQFLERRRAEDLQRQLARSKDDYLALIGHELRTPLTSVSAGIELLLDLSPEALGTQGRPLLEIVERNAVSLRHVIDDLLEVAALDSGYATMRMQRCDLADVVREALAKIEPTLGAAGLALDLTLPEELIVTGDRARLRQVVDHLLDNSLKYTPDGGKLTIALTLDGDAATLCVCDTGIGIPPEDRDKLFAHLYRSPYARDRRIPGSGLGLVVIRAILERHGGSIRLEELDRPGTCFVVRLPVTAT
jgi:signal transduction histidine kinase/PAS domain-containing protein